MGYMAGFKGSFKFSSNDDVMDALKVLEDETANPDDREPNSLMRNDFTINDSGIDLNVHFSGSLSCSSWYGCKRVICKMSKKAVEGKVKCSFEGDPDEYVKAGSGWD